MPALPPDHEELLQSCIREFYLKPERPCVAALAREVKRCFSERDLRPPNYRTVRRRVEALDARVALKKREGAKRAKEKYGPVGVSTLRSDLPLDVVQIDHTLMDVVVVDREQRQSIGRPWLTLAIDISSRAVMGSAFRWNRHRRYLCHWFFRMRSCLKTGGWRTGNSTTSTGPWADCLD